MASLKDRLNELANDPRTKEARRQLSEAGRHLGQAGQQLAAKGQEIAKDPKTKAKIDDVRRRFTKK